MNRLKLKFNELQDEIPKFLIAINFITSRCLKMIYYRRCNDLFIYPTPDQIELIKNVIVL